MTQTGMYLGPIEFARRFMAGFNVKSEHYLTDGSPFVFWRMPRGHVQRLQQIINNHPNHKETKPMAEIENTSDRDSTIHLMGSLSEGTDSYITGMESAGQQQLVNSDKLPAEADWPAFEALGFVKGDPVEGDSLFVTATLPEGWSRRADSHAMWSYIVDERGVSRVSIFYKAAFYDRRASMRINRVGYELAADIVYGKETVSLPESWPLLTAAERAEARQSLTEYLDLGKSHPEIYGNQAARAEELDKLIAGQENA